LADNILKFPEVGKITSFSGLHF